MPDEPVIDFDIDDDLIELNITLDADTNIIELSNTINKLPAKILFKIFGECELTQRDDSCETFSSMDEAVETLTKRYNVANPLKHKPKKAKRG